MSFLAKLFTKKRTQDSENNSQNTAIYKNSNSEATQLLEQIEIIETNDGETPLLEKPIQRESSKTIQAMKIIEDADKLQQQHLELMKYKILATAEKRLKQEFEQLQLQNDQLNKDNDKLKAELMSLTTTLQKTEDATADLENKKKAAESTCTQQENTINALNIKLISHEESITTLTTKNTELVAQEQAQKEVAEVLLLEIESLEQNQLALDDRYKKLFTAILVLGVVLLTLITIVIIIYLKDDTLGLNSIFSSSQLFTK